MSGGWATRRTVTALVLGMAALAACAPPPPDEPLRKPAPPNRPQAAYGVMVPSGDFQKLQVADQVRAVDPCGLIDRERLAARGQIATVGPDFAFGDCAVGVALPERARLLARVSIDLSVGEPGSKDTETRQIAGETVLVDGIRNDHLQCVYLVPLYFPASPPAAGAAVPDVIEVPAVQYARVTAFMFSPDRNCGIADEVTASLLGAVKENRLPRRDQATVRLPLAERSPCELMSELPTGFSVSKFDAEIEPYECYFTVKGAEAGPSGKTVSVSFQLDDADNALLPIRDQRLIDVGGHPALREQDVMTNSCSLEFPVGPVVDSYLPGTRASQSEIDGSRKQVIVRVSAACPVLDRLAPIAATTFGANR
ncbi:hypothetical protein [Nocardia sp. bgisy118]|uniref:hypothetical protein n=1 Tax=Nocardia sp. bgisy118 TaxID=3413786 RepID=UPI003F4A2BF6